MKKVAVIIPCWNCEQYIRETVECLRNQTFQYWEAFLVDDQSSDRTATIIGEYSAIDPRIIYIKRPRLPKGAQTCRNVGFEMSVDVDYVVFFDADDLLAPYCLEQRVAFMESRPDLDFGVFLAKSYVEKPLELDRSLLFGFQYPDMDDLRRLLRRTHPFVVWTNIYRRSSLVKAGISWDERILSLQDSDFNLQVFHQKLKYDYDLGGRIDYYYRTWHSSDCTSRNISSDAHKKSHLLFLDKMHRSLTSDQLIKYKLEIDDYIFYFVDKFFHDRQFISDLLRLGWIRRRIWFCIRVRIYSFLKRKNRSGKRWLFPSLYSYRTNDDWAYRDYQKVLLTQVCKNSAI